MSQLRTLLWKNFLWCRRHPTRTGFMYICPLLFASFLFLVLWLSSIDDTGDCDYESLAYPPSHPALVVGSLVCSDMNRCAGPNFKPPRTVLRGFFDDQADSTRSQLCPDKNKTEFKSAVMMAMFYTCLPRQPNIVYRSIPAIDFIYRGHLLYYPENDVTNGIVNSMSRYLDDIGLYRLAFGLRNASESQARYQGMVELAIASGCYQLLQNRTFGFPDRKSAVAYAMSLDIKTEVAWGIIEFMETGSDFQYKLLSHYDTRDRPASLYLQSLVEMAIVQHLTGQKPPVLLEQKLLPKRCSKDLSAYEPAYAVLQISFSIGMVAVVQVITGEICYEKAAGLLEFLFIAGVPRWKVKLSWLVFGLVFSCSVAFLTTTFFFVASARLIEYTRFVWFLLLVELYACALVSLCFLLASLVSNPHRASVVAFLALLFAYLTPIWAQLVPQVGYVAGRLWFVRSASFLHCTIALQIGLAYLIAWEKVETGVSWINLDQSPIIGDRFKGMMEVMGYLIFQSFFYFLLSWYFDHVAPSKHGLKLPWYFPFDPNFWFERKGHATSNIEDQEQPAVNADIEPLNHRKSVGIFLQSLTKRYNPKVVVDHLSATFYSNEVTVLLGHNGAGKSTTMNMLTGMVLPSTGTAIVNGNDIWKDMNSVRSSLGFCPQYDIVYLEMTVRQHLEFFGTLKGLDKSEIAASSMKILEQFDMGHQLDTAAMDLSGGQRRKLSITIALLKEPATVILDEPTSAVDPFSRRAIWDVILRQKEHSTLLISTHYMLEADILADRIAIISQGRLKCFGTPMYLKNRYASKCYLKIAHTAKIDVHGLTEKLEQFVPLSLISCNFGETTFSMHSDVTKSLDLVEAFRFLEESAETWNISSFGLSESTMEQVFFKVATEEQSPADAESCEFYKVGMKKEDEAMKEYYNLEGIELFVLQLWGLWTKRFQISRRSKLGLSFQVLVPLFLMCVMVLLNNTVATTYTNREVMVMHPWNTTFSKPLTFYASPTPSSNLSYSLLHHGLGPMCIEENRVPEHSCTDEQALMPKETADESNKTCECRKCPVDAVMPKAESTKTRTSDTLLNLSNRNVTTYLLKTEETGFLGGIEEVKTMPPKGNDVLSLLEEGIPGVVDKIQQSNWYDDLNTAVGKVTEVEDQLALVGEIINDPSKLLLMSGDDMLSIPTAISAIVQELLVVPKTGHVIWTGITIEDYTRPTRKEKDMLHMPSGFLNAYNNVLLRSMISNNNAPKYGITMYTEEVTLNADLSVAQIISGLLLGTFSSLALLMPSFSVLLVSVNEASSGNKKLQLLMGLNKLAYWLANITWDVTLYIITVLFVMTFMTFFPNLFVQDSLIYFYIALMFGVSKILLGYVLTFMFKTARNAILTMGILSPLLTFTAIILLNWFEEVWFATVDLYLCFFPSYFVLSCLVRIQFNDYLPNPEPLLSWNVLGKRFAICSGFTFTVLLMLICLEAELFSFGFCQSNMKIEAEPEAVKDPDVTQEEEVVQSSSDMDFVLKVQNVFKSYNKKKTAVRNVTFGAKKGECFGLLGINGAGKSTLFKILTGFLKPTAGDAAILGHSIHKGQGNVAKHMSYCPQEDVLFDYLNAIEHLHFYAKIRGIPAVNRKAVVSNLIDQCDLSLNKDKLSMSLSGGNKRKLNFAIALLDYPSVIFLDEMTSGMDPRARRVTWESLNAAVQLGCTAVINSHSLEETERLCHRLAIMVNGQFKCIGGVQHLKDKYGKNYNVKFRINVNTEKLKAEMTAIWPNVRVSEEHNGYLEVEIPVHGLKLSDVFDSIHKLRQEHEIPEFSVSQTTLEHVFVNMVKQQL